MRSTDEEKGLVRPRRLRTGSVGRTHAVDDRLIECARFLVTSVTLLGLGEREDALSVVDHVCDTRNPRGPSRRLPPPARWRRASRRLPPPELAARGIAVEEPDHRVGDRGRGVLLEGGLAQEAPLLRVGEVPHLDEDGRHERVRQHRQHTLLHAPIRTGVEAVQLVLNQLGQQRRPVFDGRRS